VADDRPFEDSIEQLGRVDRELKDFRETVLARMATRRRLDVPVFFGYQSSAQSVADGVATALTLDGEAIDTHDGHSLVTNPTRWTVPSGWAGIYMVQGRATIDTASGNQFISASCAVNGTAQDFAFKVDVYGVFAFTALTPLVPVALAEGDYLQLLGTQGSGATRLTVGGRSSLSVVFVRR